MNMYFILNEMRLKSVYKKTLEKPILDMLGSVPQQFKAAYLMIAQQLFNPEKDFHAITTNGYSLDCRFPLQQPFLEQLIGT